MYQKLSIIGYVGSKDDAKFLPTGTQVARFSIAATSGYGDKKTTLWVFVSAFGKLAEIVEKYVHKGNLIMVEGELRPDENGNPRIYTSKQGNPGSNFEMIARDIKLLPTVKKDSSPEEDKFDDAFPF